MPIQLPTEPFGDSPLPDLKLDEAPLLRALVQVRFARSTGLYVDGPVIRRIADELAETFPVFDVTNDVSLNLSSSGIAPTPAQTPRWQFADAPGTTNVWLTPFFVTLETSAYDSRDSLFGKLSAVLESVLANVRPAFIERVGVRYTNRIDAPEILAELSQLFRQEMLPAQPLLGSHGYAAMQSWRESFFYNAENRRSLGVRWGSLPAEATNDPSLPPSSLPSFVLDLDSYYQDRSIEWSVDGVMKKAVSLSENAYRFFLWSLSDRALERFGGHEK
ncbi:MAG TPA: TIGR04255 family protein [Pseudolysinimonas sp.]|jgi:uncharacterized protein (TIGR04255 family)